MSDVDSRLRDEIADGAKFEVELTEDEIKVFERIATMEAVHNEIGSNLSVYRDSILRFRNEFVKRLQGKYGIKNPAHMLYDPVSKKIVSVFNQSTKAHKIVSRPRAFSKIASDGVMSLIKQLSDVFNATEIGEQDGRKQR